MPENARRKPTRRDLPALCLVYAAIFAVSAIGLPFAANCDLAKKSDLHPVAGSVEGAPRMTVTGKAGTKLHIFIRASDGLHHLTQDDLSSDVPQIMHLHVGDNVIAHVKYDPFGRDLDWLWELQRDGVTILSYEDTSQYFQRRNERVGKIAEWAGVLSLGLFAGAILLRRRFGSWRDGSGPVSRSAAAPEVGKLLTNHQ